MQSHTVICVCDQFNSCTLEKIGDLGSSRWGTGKGSEFTVQQFLLLTYTEGGSVDQL